MIKLITQIKKWIEQEAKNIHPTLEITQSKELPNGHYYGFSYQGFTFCLILQDLKINPKVSWFFHREFTIDERAYWQGKYEFKLLGTGNLTRSIILIDQIQDNEPIKTIMTRQINTMRIFTKDFRWILVMGKKGDTYE